MPPAQHNKIALAAEQLDVAIQLFLDERSDVSALTLAGAAEEILGNAAKLAGGENALQRAYKVSALTHYYLHDKELKWPDFADGENCARNAAKHLQSNRDTQITVDLRRAAMEMIVRACANFDQLGLERTDRMRDFENWFYEYEVGV